MAPIDSEHTTKPKMLTLSEWFYLTQGAEASLVDVQAPGGVSSVLPVQAWVATKVHRQGETADLDQTFSSLQRLI